MKSVVQEWVMLKLPGLRHQGVLLTAVRGCDTSSKNSPDKALVRCFREAILNPHVGDPAKAKTFIELVPFSELSHRMQAVADSHDHLPHHYLMHLIHAAEILGYYHPNSQYALAWSTFYLLMCKKLHMTPETKAELDARLCADEASFFEAQ